MKLLIRGGSIAAGYGVVHRYADILTEPLFAKGIALINRSRPGETTFDGVSTFDQDIDPFRPDMLLIHFGIDDAFQCVYRSEFQENLVQMIRLARTRFRPAVFLATSHTFDNPCEQDAVDVFYRALRLVASDLDCKWIPVHHHWAGYLAEHGLKSQDLVLTDPRHPNARGHQLIAEALMQGLNRHVENLHACRQG